MLVENKKNKKHEKNGDKKQFIARITSCFTECKQ